jgi:hypothetical protein
MDLKLAFRSFANTSPDRYTLLRGYVFNHVCAKATSGGRLAVKHARDFHRGKQRLPERAELLPGLAVGDGER